MLRRIKDYLSGLSLFWRYLFLMGVIAAVLLAALSMSVHQSSGVLRQSYLKQAEESFYLNAQSFADDLFRCRGLFSSVSDTQSYVLSSKASVPVSAGEYIILSQTQDVLRRQCSMLDLPGEYFLYFDRSQTCVTRSRCFQQADECFRSYLVSEDGQSLLPQLSSMIEEKRDRHLLIPAQRISVGGKNPVSTLILLVQSATRDQICGFLYPLPDVLSAFHMEALPEGTFLELRGNDGVELLSYNCSTGQDSVPSVQFMIPLNSLNCSAAIGIPEAYFQNTVHGAQAAANGILLASVLLSAMLCLLFSHTSVRPFRRLIGTHSGGRDVRTSSNELAAIDTVIRETREENKTLHSALLSGLLVRAFSGLPVSKKEYRILSAALPLFQLPLRVAILRDCTSDRNLENRLSMLQLLQNTLPQEFLCEYISLQEAVLLFRDALGSLELLRAILLDMNSEMEDNPRFVCGVGLPFSGPEGLGRSIRQAQFCISEQRGTAISLFVERAGEKEADAAEALDFKLFQQELAAWNRDNVMEQLEELIRCADRGQLLYPEEKFYTLMQLLRSTACEANLSFEQNREHIYLHNCSAVENLLQLKSIASDLFSQRLKVQMTEKDQLNRSIVDYIRTHFSDPSMDLNALSQQFFLSPRSIQRVVISLTGTSFKDFLTCVRMEEGARLLRESDDTIDDIALRCGYPVVSTFYRNFRKHYHMAPAEYRTEHRDVSAGMTSGFRS